MKFGASTKEEKEWIHADGWLNKPIVVDDLINKIEDYYAQKNQ
jgi:hypothetical protein